MDFKNTSVSTLLLLHFLPQSPQSQRKRAMVRVGFFAVLSSLLLAASALAMPTSLLRPPARHGVRCIDKGDSGAGTICDHNNRNDHHWSREVLASESMGRDEVEPSKTTTRRRKRMTNAERFALGLPPNPPVWRSEKGCEFV